MPHAHRKKAHVMATPIKTASRLSMSGKVVILHRKYREDEMMEADPTNKPI